MDQYIRYHKQPYAKYLDVKAFNEKFGTSIPDVEDYDAYFHFVFTEARKMQGPSEFLLVKFANHDEFKDMVSWSDLKKYAKDKYNKAKDKIKGTKAFKEAAKLAEKAKEAAKKKLKGEEKKKNSSISAIAKAKELAKKAKEKVAKAGEKPKGGESKVVNDLDELLSEEENIVEEEYDEVPETETRVASPEPVKTKEPVKNIVTEKKKIADMVLKASKDSEEYHQDMKHLIQFKSSKLPLEAQLMKGRPKYLKALRAYLKGDKDAEVKMSWRKKNKMVKVAELNPKRDSLKALLRSSAGNIRVVECV